VRFDRPAQEEVLVSIETEMLTSWNDGDARRAVVDFVERVESEGVPVEERIAVFDNDGTLWCEKPLPIQADFILRRLAEMAQADPELRGRQPWKAAYERDYGWLGKVLAEHYAGDDTNLPALAGGILAAFGGISVEEFDAKSEAFLRTAHHPTLARGYLEWPTCRWSSCSATWTRTGSRTTSPPVAAGTSRGQSARRYTASRASG
jgi:hypothetical protein